MSASTNNNQQRRLDRTQLTDMASQFQRSLDPQTLVDRARRAYDDQQPFTGPRPPDVDDVIPSPCIPSPPPPTPVTTNVASSSISFSKPTGTSTTGRESPQFKFKSAIGNQIGNADVTTADCENYTTKTVDDSPSTNSEPSSNLADLIAIFPRLSRSRLRHYLELANGDVEWATSLLLDEVEMGVIGSDDGDDDNQDVEQGEGGALVTSGSGDLVDIEDKVVKSDSIGGEVMESTMESSSHSQQIAPLDSTNPMMDEQPERRHEAFRLPLPRSFIRAAHDEYAFALGVSDVDLSIDNLPDLLFTEYSPDDPGLIKAVYKNFMSQLGLLTKDDSQSQTVTTSTILESSRRQQRRYGQSSISHKDPHLLADDPCTEFVAAMQLEEALSRSKKEFRSSLDSPVVKKIIDRLARKFDNLPRSCIEDAFVRCHYSEQAVERLITTEYSLSTQQEPCIDLPLGSSTDKDIQQTNVDNSGDIQREEEKCNLTMKEIMDEQEAVRRSIDDQMTSNPTIAHQLVVNRLKTQFPGTEVDLLNDLMVKFEYVEDRVVAELLHQGFTQLSLPSSRENNLLAVESCASNSKALGDVSNSSTSNDDQYDPLVGAAQITLIRDQLKNIKQTTSERKLDKRSIGYYTTETRKLYRRLQSLLESQAFYIVDQRSREYVSSSQRSCDIQPLTSDQSSISYIDLHGLDRQRAIIVLRTKLDKLKAHRQSHVGGNPTTAIIVSGRGGQAPILRPIVVDYLKNHGYEFEENLGYRSGHFIARLSSSRHDQAKD